MIRVVVREMFANRSILTISLQRNLVRENRSQGSVRGDGSNAIPYLTKKENRGNPKETEANLLTSESCIERAT